jgi:hypothetical protein
VSQTAAERRHGFRPAEASGPAASVDVKSLETEFCRTQAARLFRLAEQCVDASIRDKVTAMANDWLTQAEHQTEKRGTVLEPRPPDRAA